MCRCRGETLSILRRFYEKKVGAGKGGKLQRFTKSRKRVAVLQHDAVHFGSTFHNQQIYLPPRLNGKSEAGFAGEVCRIDVGIRAEEQWTAVRFWSGAGQQKPPVHTIFPQKALLSIVGCAARPCRRKSHPDQTQRRAALVELTVPQPGARVQAQRFAPAQDTVIVQAVAVGQLTVCNIIKQYLILVRMCVEARVRANEAVVQRSKGAETGGGQVAAAFQPALPRASSRARLIFFSMGMPPSVS